MAKKSASIDHYIIESAPFAKPILMHFRELVHLVCPDVEEKMKWSFPHFDYKGEMMCSMASFKQHCAIGFWKAALMKDAGKLKDGNTEAMGHYGKITSLHDLPSDKKIISHLKEAILLNEKGFKLPSKLKTSKSPLTVPAELVKAFTKNKKAKITFENFSPSHRNEYVTWITEAKTDETKNKRIATTLEWLEEGKSRHWKYLKKN